MSILANMWTKIGFQGFCIQKDIRLNQAKIKHNPDLAIFWAKFGCLRSRYIEYDSSYFVILSRQHQIYLTSTSRGRKSCISTQFLPFGSHFVPKLGLQGHCVKNNGVISGQQEPNPSDMVIRTDTLCHLGQKTKHTQFWPFLTPCFGQIWPFLATVYLMKFVPNAHFSCQQS